MTDASASPRALAARRNGAKSRGPTTVEGRTRSSRNALRHGLTAERWVVLYDEDTAAFAALLRAWRARFAPRDDLEAHLVRRLAEADWRLRRATRIEFELFDSYLRKSDDGINALGLAMIRDGHGAGAFANLLRYRTGAEREYHRLLRLLVAVEAGRGDDEERPRQPPAPPAEPPAAEAEPDPAPAAEPPAAPPVEPSPAAAGAPSPAAPAALSSLRARAERGRSHPGAPHEPGSPRPCGPRDDGRAPTPHRDRQAAATTRVDAAPGAAPHATAIAERTREALDPEGFRPGRGPRAGRHREAG